MTVTAHICEHYEVTTYHSGVVRFTFDCPVGVARQDRIIWWDLDPRDRLRLRFAPDLEITFPDIDAAVAASMARAPHSEVKCTFADGGLATYLIPDLKS